VLEKLSCENVSAEEIIRDALAKDQALDAFEKFIEKKMKDRRSARQMRLMELERQIGILEQERNQCCRRIAKSPYGSQSGKSVKLSMKKRFWTVWIF
jgi:hypothetical protein